MQIAEFNHNSIVDELKGTNLCAPDVYVQPMSIPGWIQVLDHEYQRDTDLRLKSMIKHFKENLPTLYTDLAMIIVTEEFDVVYNGITKTIMPGMYKANGHTRSLFWETHPELVPAHGVLVTVYDNINDANMFKSIYDCYDSKEAVDGAQNKIQSALRVLGMRDKVTSNVVRKGGFGTAVSIAYPGDPKDDIIEKISYFRDEILFLDNVGIFNANAPQMRFQTLYASFLMFAKMFLTKDTASTNYVKLFDACRKISNIEKEDFISSDKKWDGITAMQYEIFNECEKGWIPEGMLRKTSYATLNNQMSFFLYCLIDLWMNDKRLDRTKGFKHSAWLQYKESTDDDPIGYYNYIRNNI